MPEDLSSPTHSQLTIKNHILKALPKESFELLLPHLETMDMPSGKILYYPDEPIKHVYFPETAMISVVTLTQEGESTEAGVIGLEGMAGFNVLMGVESIPNENIVQLPGSGFQIPAAAVKQEFGKGGVLQSAIMRFIHALLIQVAQVSLCNRLHTNEERLSRWLLMCQDRSETNYLKLTQEFLAIMLGSNRATVTISAIALQNAGFIKYSRGKITVIDRAGLEDFTCDCYQVIKKEYYQLQK